MFALAKKGLRVEAYSREDVPHRIGSVQMYIHFRSAFKSL